MANLRGASISNTQSYGTSLSARGLSSGTDILLTYNTMPGNSPSTNGNTVFLWQNQPFIPYNQSPLASQPVPTNTQQGSMDFGNLQIQSKDYIIGYAVGPNPTNVSSWVYVPAAGGPNQAFQTSIWANAPDISPDVVVVHFDTPDGNQPQSSGQWVGLFQGTPSYGQQPVAKVNMANNSSQGTIALAATLLRFTTYSLAYFMGANQKMMAASFTFTTN